MFSSVCNFRAYSQESSKAPTGKHLQFKMRFKYAGFADGQSVRKEIQRKRVKSSKSTKRWRNREGTNAGEPEGPCGPVRLEIR